MSGPIGVAIIGSGIFVKEEHLPAVQSCSDLILKAVWSRSVKSAQSVSEGLQDVELYSDDSPQSYADLLKRDDIQGVIIALPILAQPSFIKQALQAGKHVLAEKPLAPDVAAGRDLVKFYREGDGKATLGIAEQFRYLNSYLYAAEQISKLGRVLGVQLKLHCLTQAGTKYFETPWRKTPEYQGGFLLDAGVHQVAALRVMLAGGGVKVKKLSAQSAQLQEHLPPVDTVAAALLLDNGATGLLSMSFGTSFFEIGQAVACEKGTVSVKFDEVTVKPVGGEAWVVDKPNEGGGVATEVHSWAESILNGKQHPRQTPEEALADLEMLEAMLKSGEQGGIPVELTLQI